MEDKPRSEKRKELVKQRKEAGGELRRLEKKIKPSSLRKPSLRAAVWAGLFGVGASFAVPAFNAAQEIYNKFFYNPVKEAVEENPFARAVQRDQVTGELQDAASSVEQNVVPHLEQVQEEFNEDYERLDTLLDGVREELELRQDKYDAVYTFKTNLQYRLAVTTETLRFWAEALGLQEWSDALAQSSDDVQDWILRQFGVERNRPRIENAERNVQLLELTVKLLEYTDRGAEAEAQALRAINRAFADVPYAGENVEDLKDALRSEIRDIVRDHPIPFDRPLPQRQAPRQARVDALNEFLEEYSNRNPDMSAVAGELQDLYDKVEDALEESDPHVDFLEMMHDEVMRAYGLLDNAEELRSHLSEPKDKLEELANDIGSRIDSARAVAALEQDADDVAENIDEMRDYGREELGYKYPLTESSEPRPWLFYTLLAGYCALGALATTRSYVKSRSKWLKHVGRKGLKARNLQPRIAELNQEIGRLDNELARMDFEEHEFGSKAEKIDAGFKAVEAGYVGLAEQRSAVHSEYMVFLGDCVEYLKCAGVNVDPVKKALESGNIVEAEMRIDDELRKQKDEFSYAAVESLDGFNNQMRELVGYCVAEDGARGEVDKRITALNDKSHITDYIDAALALQRLSSNVEGQADALSKAAEALVDSRIKINKIYQKIMPEV